MEFEWDESKRLSNLDKHGIDFEDVLAVFAGSIVTVEDARFDLWRRPIRDVGAAARARCCNCPY